MGGNECLSLIPAVLASVALLCSLLYSFWCESFQLDPTGDLGKAVAFGPWYARKTELLGVGVDGSGGYYVTQDVCVSLDGEVDSKVKATRAFTVICVVLGGLYTIVLLCAPCSNLSPGIWKILALQFLTILPLFQGLTFLILKSDVCNGTRWPKAKPECKWDAGSSANVCAIILWFLTGLVMMAAAASDKDDSPSLPVTQEPPPPEKPQSSHHSKDEKEDEIEVKAQDAAEVKAEDPAESAA